ncbi:MAG: hypothetical protein ACK470_04385 [Pseudanabaena sp.]
MDGANRRPLLLTSIGLTQKCPESLILPSGQFINCPYGSFFCVSPNRVSDRYLVTSIFLGCI